MNKFLYHATYFRYLDSIKKHGLGGSIINKSWNDAIDGVVCFAHDEDEAESYAECADIIEDDESILDEIIVLQIDSDYLDKNLLFTDSNLLTENGMLYGTDIPAPLEYHGVVSFEAIKQIIYKGTKINGSIKI